VIGLAQDPPSCNATGSPEWDACKYEAWQGQPQLAGNPEPFERVGVAFALLMTSPGIPLIYYGDEIGMPGAGDPDNRRPMQWSGLSTHQMWLQTRLAALAHIRGAHSALRRGLRQRLGADADVLVYQMTDGSDQVFVALNRGDGASAATGLPAGTYHELVSDSMVTAPLMLAPRSAAVLVRP